MLRPNDKCRRWHVPGDRFGHRRAHCLRSSTIRAIFRGETRAFPTRQLIFNRWNEAVSSHIWCSRFSISAARSPITTQGPMVLPVVTRGMIDPSAIRRFSIP